MTIYTTEDAYMAFVAGRITRDEFFRVCSVNAERDHQRVLAELESDARRRLVCGTCGSTRGCRCG